MFQELLIHIREGAFRALTRVRVEQRPAEAEAEEEVTAPAPVEPMFQHKEPPQQLAYSSEPEDVGTPGQARAENKPGRNDPCPCGSGKKYKKCCGANDR